MLFVDLALRWLHILSAITLAGGVIFWRCALMGATETLPDTIRQEVAASIRSRWSKLVMASSGLLLITGLANFMLIVQRFELDKAIFPGSKYHILFGIKFLLSLAVFTLAALLSGKTSAAENLRRNEKLWLNITVLLAIAVVCLGGLLRAAGRQPKTAQSVQPDRTITEELQHTPGSLTRT